jgi:hypothetical protein
MHARIRIRVDTCMHACMHVPITHWVGERCFYFSTYVCAWTWTCVHKCCLVRMYVYLYIVSHVHRGNETRNQKWYVYICMPEYFMPEYLCVRMYVSIMCVCECVCVCFQDVFGYMWVSVCVCVCVCVHMYTSMHIITSFVYVYHIYTMCASIHTSVQLCTHICMSDFVFFSRTGVYTVTHLHLHVYNVHAYIYTCIHTRV